ncbi:unnamed protein product [Ceutorhynchus assimilis]|uniref:C2H2-type domain-containing protein n=1 Tax=Ceutorhynchus assimilis TaxID=467358 RepID=A0A9N9MGK6_9CUCU|nr:unnamed protein product [Ceutorhynchus assimilis]
MDIKTEIDVEEDVCSQNISDEKFTNKTQYFKTDVKLEKYFNEVSIPSDSTVVTENIILNFEEIILPHLKKEIKQEFEQLDSLKPDPDVVLIKDDPENINFEKFQCNFCQRKFEYNCRLKSHLITHSSERPFECDFCLAKFKRRGELNMHLITHSEKFGFECGTCNRKFIQERNIKRHLFLHPDHKMYHPPNNYLTSNNYFQCHICYYKFKKMRGLKRHMHSHNVRNIKCDFCDLKFKRKQDLKWHLVGHADKCDFECHICHRKFKRKLNLSSHLEIHDTISNAFAKQSFGMLSKTFTNNTKLL